MQAPDPPLGCEPRLDWRPWGLRKGGEARSCSSLVPCARVLLKPAIKLLWDSPPLAATVWWDLRGNNTPAEGTTCACMGCRGTWKQLLRFLCVRGMRATRWTSTWDRPLLEQAVILRRPYLIWGWTVCHASTTTPEPRRLPRGHGATTSLTPNANTTRVGLPA